MEKVVLHVAGREVAISNPTKVYFPEVGPDGAPTGAGITKLELVRYYLAVADGALRAAGGRPNVLVRYADGIAGQGFYQKRAPEHRPDWVETVTLAFPSGRTAEEVVPRDASHLAWMANLGCLELHPHPVRASDLDHPDELRIDLDPVPGVAWPQIREVAQVARAVLDDLGLVGWPKTSGSRGIHVIVRLTAGRYTFADTWRAALAFAREVERRAPTIATTRWWKEERHGVFLDYNQNAKDRTTAAAYSVRPKPDARVSAPVTWGELESCEPGDFTLRTMPERFAAIGDRHAAIDDHASSLERLLELADRQDADGAPAAPGPLMQPRPAPKPQAAKRPRAAAGGRRVSKKPLVEIGRSVSKERALAGLDRWRERHPEVVPHLLPADVLVDSMRGRSSTWTRIRVNLEHVPEALRPAQGALDPDEPPAGFEDWKKPPI
ncbi:MAG: DNA polymerase domain-containing protein [Deltaproteobacteria bacterium]|nr:DNA polymerase domain-containing protein [Deltaproteobacteria bacterium]